MAVGSRFGFPWCKFNIWGNGLKYIPNSNSLQQNNIPWFLTILKYQNGFRYLLFLFQSHLFQKKFVIGLEAAGVMMGCEVGMFHRNSPPRNAKVSQENKALFRDYGG